MASLPKLSENWVLPRIACCSTPLSWTRPTWNPALTLCLPEVRETWPAMRNVLRARSTGISGDGPWPAMARDTPTVGPKLFGSGISSEPTRSKPKERFVTVWGDQARVQFRRGR